MPPGPRKLPLIGNLHQLVGSLPHHRLRDLARKHGPLMHLQLGEASTIVVSSSEIAEEILKTNGLIFAERPLVFSFKKISYDGIDIAFAPYGNYWRQLRKICTIELLSTKRVQSFRSIREQEVSNLIKEIHACEGSVVNLSEKVSMLTYGITSRAAFGNKCKGMEGFISSVVEFTNINPGFCMADLYPSIEVLQVITGIKSKLENLHRKVDQILQNILDEHKQRRVGTEITKGEAEEDLIDVFLKLQLNEDHEVSLSDSHIKAIIWDIFSGGSETSSTIVEWAMAELLKNPRVMEKTQAEVRQVFDRKGYVDESGIQELKYLKSVVKETLRLHPSVPLLVPRESRETCDINGYTIPAKTRVIVNAWAIARDPMYWNEAEIFYPERFLDSEIDYKGADFAYIPFGAGRRICPGIAYALPNIELPLAQLLYHFDWKLPNAMKQEDLDMTDAFGMTAGRKNDLLLIPIPYRPLAVPECNREE